MNFYQVLTLAVNDILNNGYRSQNQIDDWMRRLKQAAIQSMLPESKVDDELERHLGTIYTRMVTNKGILKTNASLKPYSISKLKPELRKELTDRMVVAKSLIKFNRDETISNTMRRFQGWATSVPKGGMSEEDKVARKKDIKKALESVRFKERRVIIDQGHKLSANLNDIVCVDNGAIAAVWHSTHQAGYHNRKDHLERDGNIYVIEKGWAYKQGLIKAPFGFTTDITMPGQEVFCRCRYQYLFNLSDLPEQMLTAKGRKMIQSRK